MKEMRMRPKSDYLHKASLQELYVLGEHWQSEMEYCTDEINFLNHLVEKYFILLASEGNIHTVQGLAVKVHELERICQRLKDNIRNHQKKIELLMENVFSNDEQRLRDHHAVLEDEVAGLVDGLRTVKKEIFVVAEKVLQHEKLQHLLA